MKGKLILMFLAFLMLFTITACGNNAVNTGDDNKESLPPHLKAPKVQIEYDGFATFWWDYAESFVIRLDYNDKEIPIKDHFYQLNDGQAISVKAISYEPRIPESEWSDWYVYNASDIDVTPSETYYEPYSLSTDYIFGFEDYDGTLHMVYFENDGKIVLDGVSKYLYRNEEKLYEKVGDNYIELDLNINLTDDMITFNGTVYNRFCGLFLPSIIGSKTYVDVETGNYIEVDSNNIRFNSDWNKCLFYYQLGNNAQIYAKNNNDPTNRTFLTVEIEDDIVTIGDEVFYEIVYTTLDNLPMTYPANIIDKKEKSKELSTSEAYYFSKEQESLCHYFYLWDGEYPSCLSLGANERYYVALINQKYYAVRFYDYQKWDFLPIIVDDNGLTVGDYSYEPFTVIEYTYKEFDGVYKPIEISTGDVVEYFGQYANVKDNQTIGVFEGSLSYSGKSYNMPIKTADAEYLVAYVNLDTLKAKKIDIIKESDNTFNIAMENATFYPVIDKIYTSLTSGIYKNADDEYLALNYEEGQKSLSLNENGRHLDAVMVNNATYFKLDGKYIPFTCDESSFEYNGNSYSKIKLVESTATEYYNTGTMQMFFIDMDASKASMINTLYIKGASDGSYQMVTYNNGTSVKNNIEVFYEENAVTYRDNFVGYKDGGYYHTLRSWKAVEKDTADGASNKYFYVDGIKYQNISSEEANDYLTQIADFGNSIYFAHDAGASYLAVDANGIVYRYSNANPDVDKDYYYKLENGYFVSTTGISLIKYGKGTLEYYDEYAYSRAVNYEALTLAKSLPQGINSGDYIIMDRYSESRSIVEIRLNNAGILNYYEREGSTGNYAFTKGTYLFESPSGDKDYYFYEDTKLIDGSNTLHRLATIRINEEEKVSISDKAALSKVFTDGAGTYFTRGTETYHSYNLYDTDGTLLKEYYNSQGYSKGFVVDKNYNVTYFKCVIEANAQFIRYEERLSNVLSIYASEMFDDYYIEYLDENGTIHTRRARTYDLYRKPIYRVTDQNVLGYYKEVDENGKSSYLSGINIGISENNNIAIAPNVLGQGATSGYGLMSLGLYTDGDGNYYWMLNERDIEPYASCTIKDGKITMIFPYESRSGEIEIDGITYKNYVRINDVKTYYQKATAYDASSHNGAYIVKNFSLKGLIMDFIIEESTLKVKVLRPVGIRTSEYTFYQYEDYIFAIASATGEYTTLFDNYRFAFDEDGTAFIFSGIEKEEMYQDIGEATVEEFNSLLDNTVHRYVRLDPYEEYSDLAYMELDGINGVVNFVNYHPEGVSSVNTFRKLSNGEIYFMVGDIKYVVLNGTTENIYSFCDRDNYDFYDFYRILPDDGQIWNSNTPYESLTDGTYTYSEIKDDKIYMYTCVIASVTEGEGEEAITLKTATLTVSWPTIVDGVERMETSEPIVYYIYKTSYQNGTRACYFLCDANGIPKTCLDVNWLKNTLEINGNIYML